VRSQPRAKRGVSRAPAPGIPHVVDDNEAQFFVSVGKLCADARLAGLTVSLTLADGARVAGVPEPPAETEAGDELDTTGYADAVTVGGVTVRLSDVVEASLRRPDEDELQAGARAHTSLEA
jgi:hypothetical protein